MSTISIDKRNDNDIISDEIEHEKIFNKEHLNPIIQTILGQHDSSTFTPKMLYKELANALQCPVNIITDNYHNKTLIKNIARNLVGVLSNNTNVELKNSIVQLEDINTKKTENKETAAVDNNEHGCSEDYNNDGAIKDAPIITKEEDAGDENTQNELSKNLEKKKRPYEMSFHDTKLIKKTVKKRNKGKAKGLSSSPICNKKNREASQRQDDIHKQRLRKLVKDLSLGPATYRGLSQDSTDYCNELEERIIQKAKNLGIVNTHRLPSSIEATTYKRQKQRAQELEGVNPENIINSQRVRHVRHSKLIVHHENTDDDSEDSNSDDLNEEYNDIERGNKKILDE